jgi:hypothetical protein
VVVSERVSFFEVVRINEDSKHSEIAGKLGHILGISEEDGIIHGYGVWIYDRQEVWSVDPNEFELLGYKDELAASDYGKHSSIGVSPNGRVK